MSAVLEHVLAVYSVRLGQMFGVAEVLSRLKETDINFVCTLEIKCLHVQSLLQDGNYF